MRTKDTATPLEEAQDHLVHRLLQSRGKLSFEELLSRCSAIGSREEILSSINRLAGEGRVSIEGFLEADSPRIDLSAAEGGAWPPRSV
jgi:hypothetical protein